MPRRSPPCSPRRTTWRRDRAPHPDLAPRGLARARMRAAAGRPALYMIDEGAELGHDLAAPGIIKEHPRRDRRERLQHRDELPGPQALRRDRLGLQGEAETFA